MDLETPRPYNLIHGQGIFRVAGYNMVLDDVGSTVYLTDKNGVTYEVVVDEVISKQLFKGHTAALLEPGDYKLIVKSRAGDAEGPLQTSSRKVKYLKVTPPVEAPTLTPGSFDTELQTDVPWSCDGTHLKGCKIHLIKRNEETEEVEIDKTLVESWDGSDTHAEITVGSTQVHEFENGANVELTFTNAAGSAHAGLCLDKGA